MDEQYDVAIVQNEDGSREEIAVDSDWKVLIPKLKELFPDEHDAIDQHFQLIQHVQRWIPLFIILRLFPHWLYSKIIGLFPAKLNVFRQTTSQVLHEL